MADAILRTRFTGDDSHFQRVNKRVIRGGKAAGKAMRGLGASVGALGVGFGFREVLKDFDRMSKIATRLNTTTESIQRLSFVAGQSGSNIEQLQGILTRLDRRTGEALQNPDSSAAKAFDELGISFERLAQMSPEDKLKEIADAYNRTGGSERGLASLMRILDTEVRELIPMLQLGSDGITKLGESISVTTDENTAKIAKFNDQLDRMKTNLKADTASMFAAFSRGASSFMDDLERMEVGMSGLMRATLPGVSIDEAIAQTGEDLRALTAKREQERIEAKEGPDKWGFSTEADRKREASTLNSGAAGAFPKAFERQSGFGGHDGTGNRGGYRPPVSSAAKKSQQETSKFFKEAKAHQDRVSDSVETIAGFMTEWSQP